MKLGKRGSRGSPGTALTTSRNGCSFSVDERNFLTISHTAAARGKILPNLNKKHGAGHPSGISVLRLVHAIAIVASKLIHAL
jgi:hypothetical protein